MNPLFFLSFFVLANAVAFTQSTNNDLRKSYKTGYQNIITKDSGRVYKPNAAAADQLYFRPVEIDIWYPATPAQSNPCLRYGDLLNLLEQRSNRFQNDTIYHNLASELVQLICTGLDITDTSALTHLKTGSYRNADPANQRFPLIVYMCAFNGMSYENLNVFEWLASHGYIIACVTSVGKYPGNMSTRPDDLMEQVYDGLFTINYLKARNNVDSTKIGVLGYSWGGLAALTLAMHNDHIKAVLSLDGSEMHYYGESAEEDKDFDQQRSTSLFRLSRLNAPYAYLESGFKQNEREVDSIFNPLPFITTPKLYLHFPWATHEDFSCLPALASRLSETKDKRPKPYGQVNQFVLNYFDRYLGNNKAALSAQLTALWQQQILDSAYPTVLQRPEKKYALVIRGRVADVKNNTPLAYVNVGIPGKNIGTVTQQNGSFILPIDRESINDSIKISMAGYQSQSFSITDLLAQKPAQNLAQKEEPCFLLTEKVSELKEVIISAKTVRVKTIGNTATSRLVSVAFPLRLLGSEIGIKIKLGNKPVILKSFQFTISSNRLDTSVFRLNIYHFKNGAPSENTLRQNILIPVGKQTGGYAVNLSDYKIVLKDDILLSLESIEGSSSALKPGAIFLSAGLLNSPTWHRQTSQGEWKKVNGIGVGFNLRVQRLSLK